MYDVLRKDTNDYISIEKRIKNEATKQWNNNDSYQIITLVL